MTEQAIKNIPEFLNNHCQYVMANGSKCKGYTGKNSKFCFSHDPELEEARREANSKGGKAKRERNVKPLRLKEPEDIIPAIETTINAVQSGELSPSEAEVIFKLIRSFTRMFGYGS